MILLRKGFYFLFSIKMNYYWFNREEILQKAKEKYDNCGGKGKAAEYYKANKDVLKEKARNRYKNLSKEEKQAKKGYSKNKYKEMKKNANLFLSYMSEQKLKFDHIVVNKKDFHASKEALALDLVESSKILVPDRFNTVKIVLNILLAIYPLMM